MKNVTTAVMNRTDYQAISRLLVDHKKPAVRLKMRDAKLPVQLLPNTDELPKTVKALLDGWNLGAFSNLSLSS